MPAGEVVIYDLAGDEISRIPAAVSESGWVAIPARLCVGGYSWYFFPPAGEALEINGGILGDRDDVGLWQFRDINPLSGPPIFPVKPDQPVIWFSIVSEKQDELKKAPVISEQQNFYHINLPESIDEPGVMIQDQKMVGWTFGPPAGGGYFWKGPDEKNLVYELSVSDLYRLTFENSREEQFIIAYSQTAAALPKQLKAFADGFRHEPILFKENTPPRLKTEAVIQKMRSIISQLIELEIPIDIVSVFDGNVFSNAGDVSFMTDVLSLSLHEQGPAEAIGIVENVISDPGNFDENQILHIRRFHKELYVKWMNRLMGQRDYKKGMTVYRQAAGYFEDAPDIHFIGARLALVQNDWETAEHILYSQRFPLEMADQIRTLESQVSALKFQENKIVIRFSPGAGRIPVSGILNGRLRQDFAIDTGASMVTIPESTAEKLGIDNDDGFPVHELVTAGGIIEAPQVVIDAIQIGEWTEYNVTAYIVDMPGQPGLGLLGLNYLNRFRMDLNTTAGILTLAPR